MICYADMTFCKYWKECRDGEQCHRALTDDVNNAASTEGLGVCVFMEHPECYEAKHEKK